MPEVNIPQTLRATETFKTMFAGGNRGSFNPSLQKDFNVALGLQPVDLRPGAIFVVPVNSPLRNMIPRESVDVGGTAHQFKAIVGINTANAAYFSSEGALGNQVTTNTVSLSFPYKEGALSDTVTFTQQILGRGQIDSRATATTNLLRAVMIAEEKAILGGLSSASVGNMSVGGQAVVVGGAIAAPAAPGVATATTGGTIAAATYFVSVTAVGYMGESIASTAASQVTTGATSTITVTPPARVAGSPVLYYNIYIGTVNTATASYQKIVQATNGAAVVLTSYTADTQTKPTVDASSNSLAYNGIISQIAASGSGAYINDLNGPLTLAALGTAVKKMFDNAQADPDLFVVPSTESNTITDLTLGAANTPYFLVIKEHNEGTAGYRVARLINKTTGTEIRIVTHPYLPQGNILILSTQMPDQYPGNEIDSVWKMRLPMDYAQFDYAVTGPKWNFEIRTIGCLLLQYPAIQGWIRGIQ